MNITDISRMFTRIKVNFQKKKEALLLTITKKWLNFAQILQEFPVNMK